MKTQRVYLMTTILFAFFYCNITYGQKLTIPSFEQEFYVFNRETMVYDFVSKKKEVATVIFDLNPSNPTISIDHGKGIFSGKIISVSLPGKRSELISSITIKYTDNDNVENYVFYKYNDEIEFSTIEFLYLEYKTFYQIYDPTLQAQKQIVLRLLNLRDKM